MGSPGATVAFANLGTASTQVIGADSSRKEITFSNPNVDGNVNLAVCQAFDLSGNALTAGFSATGANAGNFAILPGGERRFTGNVQGAWNSAAKSGTTNNLTMWVVRSA
jgi:hypothetical protein